MRGVFLDQGALFSYVSPETRVPVGHPLRKIRGLVRDVLAELSRSFARLYAKDGRPSVAPEQLLSALLIQALYGIRSERQLIEQLDYTCCIDGLSVCRRTMRSGIRRRSPRTANDFSRVRCSRSS